VSSILTLVVITVAFLPQVKQILVVIRDVVLWVTLVAVMAATGWLAWTGVARSPWKSPSTAADEPVPASDWPSTPVSRPVQPTDWRPYAP
jgi:hypothetical protein